MKRLSLVLAILLLLISASGCQGKSEETKERTSVKKTKEKKDNKKKGDKKSDIDLKSIFNKDKKEDTKESPEREGEEPSKKRGGFDQYEGNQMVEADLDGDGKKETLQLQLIAKEGDVDQEEYPYMFDAYLEINGQIVENLGSANQGFLYVMDMDPSDSYLEVFTAVSELEPYEDVKCFHYKDSKPEEIFFSDDRVSFPGFAVKNLHPDGVLELYGEGVFNYYISEDDFKDLGQYPTSVKYILKDEILVNLGSVRHEKTSDMWRETSPYYLTIDSMAVFDVINGSPIAELKRGDVFYLQSVKKYNKTYESSYGDFIFKDAWAEIKTGSGARGWIEIPAGYFYATEPSLEYPSPYHWG